MAKQKIETRYVLVSEYLRDPVGVMELSKQGPVVVVDEDGKERLSMSRGYEPDPAPARLDYRVRRGVTVKR